MIGCYNVTVGGGNEQVIVPTLAWTHTAPVATEMMYDDTGWTRPVSNVMFDNTAATTTAILRRSKNFYFI